MKVGDFLRDLPKKIVDVFHHSPRFFGRFRRDIDLRDAKAISSMLLIILSNEII